MKSTMAKVTAILSIVFGCLGIIGGIVLAVVGSVVFSHVEISYGFYSNYGPDGSLIATYVVLGAFIAGFAIAQIVCGKKLLNRINEKGSMTGYLIAILVLSLLGGSIVTVVFAIIALCMPNDSVATSRNVRGIATGRSSSDVEFDDKVKRLKQYKEDGIITEAQYKEKLDELVRKHISDL